MKLGLKLLAAPVLTAVVVFSMASLNTALLSREAVKNSEGFRNGMESFRTITSVQDQMGQLHAGVYRTVALIGSLDEPKIKAFRESAGNQLDGLKRTLAALSDGSGGDAELAASIKSTTAQIDKYRGQADSAIDLASVDPNTGIAAMQGADETFGALSKSLGGMVARMDQQSSASLDLSAERSRRTSLLLGLLGLAAAAATVGVAWWMQRRVVNELGRAVRVAHEVASGNLAADARTDRSDEVGDLLRAMQRMTQQLSTSLATVLDSSTSIENASAEIATGNQDLSQRTEQTASNLQQAASSMVQLTGNVKQSADSARQANQLASSAAEVAARGGAVVSQVVSTMDEINASSKRIGDIIGVIDGIAFQTNILALNAAVEAARAGEQGRGFAVVAGEVRSLAQRSAQAAREIKSLIGASVEKVDSGSRLVADAGQTMSEIVGSVQRVTDIISEITAAAAEQSEGIGQVNQSVAQLDQMTQQNAALVEESAAAAESLKDQAARLRSIVNNFQLGVAA